MRPASLGSRRLGPLFLSVDFGGTDWPGYLRFDLAEVFFAIALLLDERLAELAAFFFLSARAFALRLFADFDDDARRLASAQLTRARLRLARVDFPRRDFSAEQRTGLTTVFQPISRSLRNALGIASSGVGPSTTASTAASDRSARTSMMILPGWRAFAA